MKQTVLNIRGFQVFKGLLGPDVQQEILEDVRNIVSKAPLFSPITPYGKPMSVQMTSAGRLGWYADRSGYRYQDTHPNGSPWPEIPKTVLKVWKDTTELERLPDCCLVNFYPEKARMGLHQDKDEVEFDWPVVSISLGDDGLFRVGGISRTHPTESIWLTSGDVVVMGGDARLAYHGIDRIRVGSSSLLAKGGRINLTLRVIGL